MPERSDGRTGVYRRRTRRSRLPGAPPDGYLPGRDSPSDSQLSAGSGARKESGLTAESTRTRDARAEEADRRPAIRCHARRRAGLAQHQRDPRALDGRRRGGPVGPPGHADGARPGGVRALDAGSSGTTRGIPDWPDRDRFVLSCGHASMLLYALLHLSGYDLSLDDIKRVPPVGLEDAGPPGARPHARRRDHDRSAGPGRGQRGRHGHRRAVPGRALQPARATRIIDHRIWAFASDGDLMEGVAERGLLAGRPPAARQAHADLRRQPHHDRRRHRALLLARTCRGGSRPTAGTSSGWRDGNDLEAIAAALEAARAETARPTLVVLRTYIADPAPTKRNTAEGPRRAARRGGGPPHQGDHGLARGARVLRARRRARALARGRSTRGAGARGRVARPAGAVRRGPSRGGRASSQRWLSGTLPEGWDAAPAGARTRERAARHPPGVGARAAGDRRGGAQPGGRLRRPRRQHRHHPQAGRQLRAGRAPAAPFTGACASTAWRRASTASPPTAGSGRSAAPSWSSPTT